jgi:hypothetical protein
MRVRVKLAVGAALAVALALFGAVSLMEASSARAASSAFCGPQVEARDFGFAALPALHELDARTAGRDLGHPHVLVEGGLQEVRTVNRPGRVGYRFTESSSPNPVFVNWTVTETVWAVDSHGEHPVEVGHTGIYVNSINVQHEPSIELSPPHREGFYRFDLRILARGRTIGTYSSYLKLVRPSSRARLRLEHHVVRAGGLIRWRLGNLGSEQISFGGEPTVQRWEKGAWTHVHGIDEGISLLMLFFLPPGAEGECGSLRLPADLAPGRYRLVEPVSLFHWPRKNPVGVELKAPFTVP